jgi:hypothetical protein
MNIKKRMISLLALPAIAISITVSSANAAPVTVPAATPGNADNLASKYQVNGPFTNGNLSVYFIKGKDRSHGSEYLTLPEAISRKQVVVHETGDVNTLKIDNQSNAVVFIQSGEIVKGGQQDRALQSDMLIQPHAKSVSLPCFCVEPGRWSQRSSESVHKFDSAYGFVVGNEMQLAIKRDGDQSKVWSQVEAKQRQLSQSLTKSVVPSASPSSLQLTLEQKDLQEATNKQIKELSSLVDNEKDAIGYAIAINGKIANADIYASGALFKKLWPGLIKSAAIEALAQKGSAAQKAPASSDVRAVIAETERAKPTVAKPTKQVMVPSLTSSYMRARRSASLPAALPPPAPGMVETQSRASYGFMTLDSLGNMIHENIIGK